MAKVAVTIFTTFKTRCGNCGYVEALKTKPDRFGCSLFDYGLKEVPTHLRGKWRHQFYRCDRCKAAEIV